MKKMFIYEPAMFCSTGLCGVSVDPELLRLSTVISSLQKNGVEITRYNLTSAPMAFVNNKEVNRLDARIKIVQVKMRIQHDYLMVV